LCPVKKTFFGKHRERKYTWLDRKRTVNERKKARFPFLSTQYFLKEIMGPHYLSFSKTSTCVNLHLDRSMENVSYFVK